MSWKHFFHKRGMTDTILRIMGNIVREHRSKRKILVMFSFSGGVRGSQVFHSLLCIIT